MLEQTNTKHMNKIQQKRAGFTLIELLVVISIIALLSSVVLVAVQSARQKAQISKVNSELGEFVKALEIYKTSYGHYPYSTNCYGGGSGHCVSDLAEGTDDFSAEILTELKNKNIYNGDLINIFKSTPNFWDNGFLLYYQSIPSTTINSLVYCDNKLLKGVEYVLQFKINNSSYTQITGLDSTYIGKMYGGPNRTSPSDFYCSPKN